MENSEVTKNNEQGDLGNGADKPKGSKGRKILIVCSFLIILAVIIAVAAYFMLGNKYAKMAEQSVNMALSNIKAEYKDNFQYEPFTCSGLKQITCKGSYMELNDVFAKFTFKDFSFTLNPTVYNLGISTKGIVDITTRDFSGNSLGNVDVNFDCGTDIALLSAQSMLSSDTSCNANIGNIKSEQKNILYIKNDILKEYKTMITFLKSLSDTDLDIANKMISSPFIITDIKSKISASNLFDDIIALIKQVAGKFADDITKESAAAMYNAMKDDFLKYGSVFGSEEQVDVVKMLISALDGVITNGDNLIDIKVDLKDMTNLDNLFGSIDIINPKDYNITIQSGK